MEVGGKDLRKKGGMNLLLFGGPGGDYSPTLRREENTVGRDTTNNCHAKTYKRDMNYRDTVMAPGTKIPSPPFPVFPEEVETLKEGPSIVSTS